MHISGHSPSLFAKQWMPAWNAGCGPWDTQSKNSTGPVMNLDLRPSKVEGVYTLHRSQWRRTPHFSRVILTLAYIGLRHCLSHFSLCQSQYSVPPLVPIQRSTSSIPLFSLIRYPPSLAWSIPLFVVRSGVNDAPFAVYCSLPRTCILPFPFPCKKHHVRSADLLTVLRSRMRGRESWTASEPERKSEHHCPDPLFPEPCSCSLVRSQEHLGLDLLGKGTYTRDLPAACS